MRGPDAAPLDDRRASVSDLLDLTRPLTARSALASALLGAREPRLPVADLVAAASLFGISAGAARTCLWRMVANGELTTDNATYALAGHLLERRRRVDDAAHAEPAVITRWDGTWELAVVSLDRRYAADRAELRKAAAVLHFAEIREGVWTRPDNLDPHRLPASRAVLDQQCVQFRAAESTITVEAARSLFLLDRWSTDAARLALAMDEELAAAGEGDGDDQATALTYQFSLSIAAVRHLQLDPVLPAALLPDDWPAAALRSTYRRFERAFQRHLSQARRAPG
jgi:phenylacetic acid degradation operon negative regulatory protein